MVVRIFLKNNLEFSFSIDKENLDILSLNVYARNNKLVSITVNIDRKFYFRGEDVICFIVTE